MFEFALPWILLVLPFPVLILRWVSPAKPMIPWALTIPFFDRLGVALESQKQDGVSFFAKCLLLSIWVLMVLAAAGPRWVGDPLPLAREGRNIMLALDLSGSMEMNDMIVNGQAFTRLAVVKHAAKQFVDHRENDRIGLILFGSRAYLQTPLTFDHHNVIDRIDDATVGLAGKTTSIGDAIGLAIKRLQQVPEQGRVLILLTDGANNSGMLAPKKAAQFAKMEHIKIYTIGLGSEGNAPGFNALFLGMNPAAELDEETLQAIAKMTGGVYFRATDLASLQAVYKRIDQLEAIQQDKASIRPQQEYYPWLLAAACISWLLLLGYAQPLKFWGR